MISENKENNLNRNRKRWTEEEIISLKEYWGLYSVATIAKRLKRSETAIKVQAIRLGLGPMVFSSDLIPMYTLLKEFGVTHNYLEYIKKFEAAGLRTHSMRVDKLSYKMVDIDDFWKFIRKDPELLDFSKLELYALGKEPDWVKGVRTEHFNRNMLVQPKGTQWTKNEDETLIRLVKSGEYSYFDISKRMRRSEASIDSRLRYLGIQEKPKHLDKHTFWTEDEVKILIDLIRQRKSYERMSQIMDKSANAIRAKVRRMYSTQSLEEVRRRLEG